MTSNQDEAMRWLRRSLGWERSLEGLRHAALADAATAGVPGPPPVEPPVVRLEPAVEPDRGEPVGGSGARSHGRRRSEAHRSHVHGAPVSW
jgi:hypothetical protein